MIVTTLKEVTETDKQTQMFLLLQRNDLVFSCQGMTTVKSNILHVLL